MNTTEANEAREYQRNELERYRALAAELARALSPFGRHAEVIHMMGIEEEVPKSHVVNCDRAYDLLSRHEVQALLEEPALSGTDKPTERPIQVGDTVEHVTGWRDKVIGVQSYTISTELHGSFNQCMLGRVELSGADNGAEGSARK